MKHLFFKTCLLLTVMAVFSTPTQSKEFCVLSGGNDVFIQKYTLPDAVLEKQEINAESPFMLLVI